MPELINLNVENAVLFVYAFRKKSQNVYIGKLKINKIIFSTLSDLCVLQTGIHQLSADEICLKNIHISF